MSKKCAKERRLIKFIKLLLRKKIISLSENSEGNMLENVGLNSLESAGLIIIRKGNIFPTKEAKKWLIRKLSYASEQFSKQHQIIITERNGIKKNLAESPISKLTIFKDKKNPFLKPHHIEAAKKFALLFEKSQLRARTTINYFASPKGKEKYSNFTTAELSDMAIDARRKIEQLLNGMPDECASVIIDICGLEKGLQIVESEKGWPRRSAKLVLRIGLEQLAQKFGLTPKAVGKLKGKSTYWQKEGSRPTIFE